MAGIAIGHDKTTTVVIHPGLDGEAFAWDPSSPTKPSSPPSYSEYMRVWQLEVNNVLFMALGTPLLLPPLVLAVLFAAIVTPVVVLLMLIGALLKPLLDGTISRRFSLLASTLHQPVEAPPPRGLAKGCVDTPLIV